VLTFLTEVLQSQTTDQNSCFLPKEALFFKILHITGNYASAHLSLTTPNLTLPRSALPQQNSISFSQLTSRIATNLPPLTPPRLGPSYIRMVWNWKSAGPI